jgi:chemotaxis protein CheX
MNQDSGIRWCTNHEEDMSTATTFKGVDLINPFLKSAASVFHSMLGSQCFSGDIEPVAQGHHMHAVTSVIGLTGDMMGAISISMPEGTAFQVLERMTGIQTNELDDFVRDVVGEMANMIGGQGKRDLAPFKLRLGLPQVIVGMDYAVYSPRWARHFWAPMTSDLGPFSLDIGFDLHRKG